MRHNEKKNPPTNIISLHNKQNALILLYTPHGSILKIYWQYTQLEVLGRGSEKNQKKKNPKKTVGQLKLRSGHSVPSTLFQELRCHCSSVTTSTAWPSRVTVFSIRVATGAIATWTGRFPCVRLVTTVWYMLTGIWTRPEATKVGHIVFLDTHNSVIVFFFLFHCLIVICFQLQLLCLAISL